MSMANNTSSPYFLRFAKVYNAQDVKLDFLMLCNEPPTLGEEVKEYGCNVYWIKFDTSSKIKAYFNSIIDGIKLLKKVKPDVLHVHLFDDAIPLLIAAKIVGIKHKVITKIDTGFHINHKPSYIKFDKWNNKLADHIVCVSEDNKQLVHEKEGASLSKISIVHQGFPIQEVIGNEMDVQQELRKKFEIDRQKVLIAVGRFIPLKGYDKLINAVELLQRQTSFDLRVIFVGYGDHQDEYEQMVKEKGLEDIVRFSGWIDRQQLNNLYQVANVFIHGAMLEPFGFVIAEAMANQLPIVSSRVGAANDAIDHLKSGYLVEPGDVEDMAKGIEYTLFNDTSGMVKDAYDKVNKMFTIEVMWGGHYEVYKKLMSK